ncbi:ABC transporter substrate-binding protein [Hwanghaeella sp.]|uniref:ABC transporter substrate-binding protein n=1 Tax=Hwanghaeella sp. TaxID=2605943 RepID=UPI003CCBE18C
MRRILKTAVAAAAFTLAGAGFAAAETTIEVQYPYSHLFKTTYEKIVGDFEKAYPDIKVKMRAPYESYEDGSQTVLKEAITNRLPDVTFQGLNRQRILVEKGIAQPLEPFIAKEANFEKDGYHQAMLDLSTFDGKVYGLPFSVSLPIGYYNMDIVKKAGWDKPLPSTWGEVIELCQAIKASGQEVDTMFWGWNITGNWFWQALNWSRDNTMLDATETKVNFGNDAGKWAMSTFADLVKGCDMPNNEWKEALANFSAGKVGMFFWSTSALQKITDDSAGLFTLKTELYPDVAEDGGLPAGGNAGLVLAKDPEQAEAAWKFLKFATSGQGAAYVAQTTGYMPPNKAANEVILKDFYAQHPNKFTAVRQLPLLRDWYAFPGENGLKITKVIEDAMQSIVSRERVDEPEAVLSDMVEDTQKLLPKASGS